MNSSLTDGSFVKHQLQLKTHLYLVFLNLSVGVVIVAVFLWRRNRKKKKKKNDAVVVVAMLVAANVSQKFRHITRLQTFLTYVCLAKMRFNNGCLQIC